jgi:hypothetical protein
VSDPTTESTPDSANAGLTIEPLQAGVTITNFGDSRLFKSSVTMISGEILKQIRQIELRTNRNVSGTRIA